jgi:membrane peptidoglycan carboxypeptidase
MFRFFKYLFFLCLFFVLLATAAGVGGLYYLVVKAPCPEMDEAYIESILGRESPVYYRDGKEKIGVLFQGFHRQYLSYDQIPRNFINAIVAAEDDQFFSHYGIDIPGIVRAMIANYRAGRVVQGGSTITQQTAKNLFKRESRSYKAKLKELLYALRLENRYSKEKILEFYSNQFYVNGNGHGLGVAARYYFDKDPGELSLLEAAFIAGSVKRPNYYNPFTKKNRKDARKALVRADERAGYVLGKMFKLGIISKAEYQAAVDQDIVFHQGKTSFSLNTVMDLVKDGLSTSVIADALEEHGISNIATSGARIISSVDHQLQVDTLYSLRRHLSRLDVRLRGYDRLAVQEEYKKLNYRGDGEIRVKAFVFGTISAIDVKDKEKPVITIKFGPKQADGFIDRQGLERLLVALVKYRKQRWAEPGEQDLADLLSRLQVGDRVYVSVRDVDFFDNSPTLDLERFPKIQGAALVMQHGLIRAMAGGVENRYYNRAVSAKRLMGSIFKPFLFAAAMQLGWSPLDQLDNRRNVFVFMDRPYFPRPDHHSSHDYVSMSWAGVKSENVAAVWLLYRLTEQLTPPRLREVAASLDMAPRTKGGETESYQRFKERIRDRFGIRVSSAVLNRAAYERAVQNLEADFLFDDRSEEYRQLKDLPYGLNFASYRQSVVESLANPDLKSWQRKELELRLAILQHNYLEILKVRQALLQYRNYLETLRLQSGNPFSSVDARAVTRPAGAFVEDQQGRLIYTLADRLPDEWELIDEGKLRSRLEGGLPEERSAIWSRIQLEGVVSCRAFDQVRQQMEVERAALAGHKPYSMEVLSTVRDYRVMLGLQYLLKLARQSGVSGTLEPVLSFPLGSNVVSLAEAVRMYETMTTGNRFACVSPDGTGEEGLEQEDLDGLAIIERIEGPGGEIIYSRKSEARPVFDSRVSSALSNILQDVVQFGTGRYAHNNVRLHSKNPARQKELEAMDLPLPLLGKTGTANDFRNASFLGYVPVGIAPEGAALSFSSGYAVGVYTGFDSNDPMKKGTTRITGSQGALPIWSDIADSLFRLEGIGDKLDPVDLIFNGLGLKYPDTGQLFVPVDPENGGLVVEGRGARRTVMPPAGPVVLDYGQVSDGGHFEPQRNFRPFWMNQQQSAE